MSDCKIITIKIYSEETEERIMAHVKQWCDENFQKQAEISVCGQTKTIYFPEKK